MEAGWPKTFHDLQLYQKAAHHAKFGEDMTSGSWVVGFFVQKTSVFHPPFGTFASIFHHTLVIYLDTPHMHIFIPLSWPRAARLNKTVSNYSSSKSFLGLWPLKSLKLEPKTCSQRECFYSQSLPHSIWKSEQVNSYQYNAMCAIY